MFPISAHTQWRCHVAKRIRRRHATRPAVSDFIFIIIVGRKIVKTKHADIAYLHAP